MATRVDAIRDRLALQETDARRRALFEAAGLSAPGHEKEVLQGTFGPYKDTGSMRLEVVIRTNARLSNRAKQQLSDQMMTDEESFLRSDARYKIIAHWGEGAWGHVYAAWDTTRNPMNPDAIVALKVPKPWSRLDPIVRNQIIERGYTEENRLEKEDFGQKQLTGVVKGTLIDDRFKDGTRQPMFVMRFYETSLAEEIEGFLEDKQARARRNELGLQLLSDLSHSLSQYTKAGVKHCDIKPSNVLKEEHEEDRYYLADHGIQTVGDVYGVEFKRTEMGFKYTRSPRLCTKDETVEPEFSDDVFGLCSLVWKAFTGKYFFEEEIDKIENDVALFHPELADMELYEQQRLAVNAYMSRFSDPEQLHRHVRVKMRRNHKQIPRAIRRVLRDGLSGNIQDGVALEERVASTKTLTDISRFLKKHGKKLVWGTVISAQLLTGGFLVKTIVDKVPDKIYNITVTPTTQRSIEVGDTDVRILPSEEDGIRQRLYGLRKSLGPVFSRNKDAQLLDLVVAYKLACEDEGVSVWTSKMREAYPEGGMLAGYNAIDSAVYGAFQRIFMDLGQRGPTLYDIVSSMRDYPLPEDKRAAVRTEIYLNLMLQDSSLKKKYDDLVNLRQHMVEVGEMSTKVDESIGDVIAAYMHACAEADAQPAEHDSYVSVRFVTPKFKIVEREMKVLLPELSEGEMSIEEMVRKIRRRSDGKDSQIASYFKKNLMLLTNSPFKDQERYETLQTMVEDMEQRHPQYADFSHIEAAYVLACEETHVDTLGKRGDDMMFVGLIGSDAEVSEAIIRALRGRDIKYVDPVELVEDIRDEKAPLNNILATKMMGNLTLLNAPPRIGEHINYLISLSSNPFTEGPLLKDFLPQQ